MADTQPQSARPIVLSIPPATLDQLRAQRALRKPVPEVSSDRPILTTIELAMRAGEVDAQEDIKNFCEDMDRLQAEVEDKYDAFLLDPGMGPMTYITSDGRILRDYRTWDGEGLQFETSLNGAIAALVSGAKKTDIVSLLDLIPPLENGAQCPACRGTGRFQLQKGEIVCPTCGGRDASPLIS